MQFDEALEVVGDFGLFQWLLVGYLALFVVPMHAVPMSAHVFTLLEPPHWCRQPELEEALHLTPEAGARAGRASHAGWKLEQVHRVRTQPDIPRSLDGQAKTERKLASCQRPAARGTLSVRLALRLLPRLPHHRVRGMEVIFIAAARRYKAMMFLMKHRMVRGTTKEPDVQNAMDWVCDHNWKVYVSHSVFFGSMSAGVIFFGAISDR
ncbi:hypothetical protein HPB52_014198 [Rhipicephalus sanguineus]|uniref:Uncharacterized protein n=1 Tax=Rhipicephalus sanguineus TaxID=34632 RepID=A0A9D4PJH9_RHISA|nr:hypothetical protein HPB52_014198 [Rhipicephalus sanguineus]